MWIQTIVSITARTGLSTAIPRRTNDRFARRFRRRHPDNLDADESRRINTADLYDERGEELDSVALQFQSLGGRSHFSGPVRTIRCFEDNALVKSTLATPGDGAVLVVDGAGSLRTALMGDMIAASAVANGWAGVVINGAVRDREASPTCRSGSRRWAATRARARRRAPARRTWSWRSTA